MSDNQHVYAQRPHLLPGEGPLPARVRAGNAPTEAERILALQRTAGNRAVATLMRRPLARMKIVEMDAGARYVDVEAGDGERKVYDPRDLGDLQKLIEHFQVEGLPLPPSLQAALQQAQQIQPGTYQFDRPNPDASPGAGQSTISQRAQAIKAISRLHVYSDTDWNTAASALHADLSSLEPLLVAEQMDRACMSTADPDPRGALRSGSSTSRSRPTAAACSSSSSPSLLRT